MKKLICASVIGLLLPALAMALPIVATPSDTVSESGTPFRHNLFHDASSGGGANGAILGWFTLDTSLSSTWDPNTGQLSLYVNIFSDSGLTNLVATAHATSTNLLGGGFNDFDDSSLGSITWDVWDLSNILVANWTTEFFDHQYAGSSGGNVPNSYVNNTVTLWGASGVSDGSGFFDAADLGVDLVFVVPEPPVLLLMVFGLLGIGATVRRR